MALNLRLIFGLVYGLGTIWWFWFLFGPMLIGLLAIFGLYFGLLGLLIGMSRGRPLLMRALLVGLFAAGVEWLRGDAWYLRFPWYTVRHALARSPEAWIAPVRWLGVYGFTIAVWSIAALGAFGRPWAWLAFSLIPASSLLLADFDAPDRQAILFQTENPHCHGADPVGRTRRADSPRRHAGVHVSGSVSEAAHQPERPGCPGPEAWQSGCLRRDRRRPARFFSERRRRSRPGWKRDRPVSRTSNGRCRCSATVGREPRCGRSSPWTRERSASPFATTGCRKWPGASFAPAQRCCLPPNYDSMQWGAMQHVHHALLFRLRAVENDRWIIRASSSGRGEGDRPARPGVRTGHRDRRNEHGRAGLRPSNGPAAGQPGLSARPDGGSW